MSGKISFGGCQCGSVRYELAGDPLDLYICHCRECRKQSASAFGISLMVPYAALRLFEGKPKFWSRRTDSGNTLDCAFCDGCGSRLWDHEPGTTDVICIKAGSLDEPVDVRSAIHIWTSRMLPGITVPEGAEQFPGEPA